MDKRHLAHHSHQTFTRRVGRWMLGREREEALQVVERRLETFELLVQAGALQDLVGRTRFNQPMMVPPGTVAAISASRRGRATSTRLESPCFIQL